ncbi:MAG: hypothetical protein KF803_12175 [Cyclobacteriaceae bacterium]|nr:hypothetical protein [Cyclobacteriaceae bacterium]
MPTTSKSYDHILFGKLAYEFSFTDKSETEKKIKQSLKYYKLTPYSQERVDYIRQFKNDLYAEISKTDGSKYYKKTPSVYAEMEDFNVEQMTEDFHSTYHKLDKQELRGMIGYAIYLYYQR